MADRCQTSVAGGVGRAYIFLSRKVDIRLPGKGTGREVGPPNHLDAKVDSDQ